MKFKCILYFKNVYGSYYHKHFIKMYKQSYYRLGKVYNMFPSFSTRVDPREFIDHKIQESLEFLISIQNLDGAE